MQSVLSKLRQTLSESPLQVPPLCVLHDCDYGLLETAKYRETVKKFDCLDLYNG